MLISQELYVITDVNKNFIVQTSGAHRYLTHKDHNNKGSKSQVFRVLFYDTEQRAKSGLISNILWLNDMIHYYPEITEESLLLKNKSKVSIENYIITELRKKLVITKTQMQLL